MKEQSKINLFVIAFKNLFRHKFKTVITMIAVAVGVSLYIFMDAWLLGMKIDSMRNIVNFETGAINVYRKDFFEKKDELPSYESFRNHAQIVEKFKQNGWNAAPRYQFSGSLISPAQEVPSIFYGIDPEKDRTVLHTQDFIEKGRFVEDDKFEIIIGRRLARSLEVETGDFVRLSTVIDARDNDGKLYYINQLIDLEVVGIINSPNPKTNSHIGYIPLSVLQDEMGMLLEGAVTEIIARKEGAHPSMLPGKSENTSVVEQFLEGALTDDLMVVDWKGVVADFFAIYETDDIVTRIMIGILFLLAFLGIANTMLMAVLERTKEIGMLRAMGMTDFLVAKLFVYEAGLIGFAGSMIGMFLGVIINFYMVEYGIDFSDIFESMQIGDNYGYRVVGVFKSAWNFGTIIASVIVGTIVSAYTAVPPVIKGLKNSIVDSLRGG